MKKQYYVEIDWFVIMVIISIIVGCINNYISTQKQIELEKIKIETKSDNVELNKGDEKGGNW